MPIPWFAVLKSVPWGTVIGNAPVVAEGAKKLWKAVANKPTPRGGAAAATPLGDGDLSAQVAALNEAAAKFDAQMLASSELIKALAEQNAQLVQLVEANRVRTVWLSAATAVVGLIAVVALVLEVGG